MSVQLNPSKSLGFRRPLTAPVSRSLTIKNQNSQPVAFKVKATSPRRYCVHPNSGRIEPGESLAVSVVLQAFKEPPPLTRKCKDKFLVESTIITSNKETMPLENLWINHDTTDEGKVFQQKLRVAYLPTRVQRLGWHENSQQKDGVRPVVKVSHVSDSESPSEPQLNERNEGDLFSFAGAVEPQNSNIAAVQSQDQPIVEPNAATAEHPPITPSPPIDVVASESDSWQIIDHNAIEPDSERDVATPALELAMATNGDPIHEDFLAKQLRLQEEAMTTVIPAQELGQLINVLSNGDTAAALDATNTTEEGQKLDENAPRNFVVIVLVLILTTYIFS